MTQGSTPQTITPSLVLRHGSALLLLFPAWHFLSRWYYFQQDSDYQWFLAFALPAGVLAGWKSVWLRLKRIPRSKLLFAGMFCLLLLPWGESWLNTETSMKDWSRQLFLQGVYVYVALLGFTLFPRIPTAITEATASALEGLSSRRWVYAAPPVLFFAITFYTSFFILERTPVIQDSAAHLFQAMIFLRGKLFAPLPPVPDFFDMGGDMLVMREGRWFSMYQPGFSLLLAAGMLVRAEWLVPPLLGAATLWLWISYTDRWYGRGVSLVVGLLGAISPFLLLMSSSYMVFVPELFFASVILYFCRLYCEKPHGWHLVVLFMASLFVMLIRTFSTLPFLAPVLLYTVWTTLRKRSLRFSLVIGAGFALGIAGLMYFQLRTTGDAFLPGYLVEYPDVGLGFGEHWCGRHTPARGLRNVSNDFLGLNEWLTGWHIGSIFFAMVAVLRHRLRAWDRLLLLSCLSLASFYFFFFFQDLLFGPRYFYPLSYILLIFVARSMFQNDTVLHTRGTALVILSVFAFLPFRFGSYLHTYQAGSTNAGMLKREMGKVERKTLIFLDRGVRHHFVNWNDPFLSQPAIIARNLEARNAELMQKLPQYNVSYFRKVVDVEDNEVQAEFRLYDFPDPSPPGYVSFFDLALTMQTPENYPDRDFLDTAYDEFFESYESEAQQRFLVSEMQRIHDDESLRGHFHRGLIHSAHLLILPRLALERRVKDWQQEFDPSEFRAQFNLATTEFRAAKDIGQSLLHQMEKVRRRIDRNRDGTLSDDEIRRFLEKKINPFIAGKP